MTIAKHSTPTIPPGSSIFILMGMTASGKTTLAKRLAVNPALRIRKPISTTTRAPRPGEVNGKDYYFFSRESFLKNIPRNYFLEYSPLDVTSSGLFYGLSYHSLLSTLKTGCDAVVVLDYNGARALKTKYPNNVHVFYLRYDAETAFDFAKQNIQFDESNGVLCRERADRLREDYFLAEMAKFEDAARATGATIIKSIPGELDRMECELVDFIQKTRVPFSLSQIEYERF